jgi:hypothetical protein
MTSYEGLKYQLATAARDASVSSIILDMDSPGDEAVGAFEAADAVRAAARRSRKSSRSSTAWPHRLRVEPDRGIVEHSATSAASNSSWPQLPACSGRDLASWHYSEVPTGYVIVRFLG